MLDERVLETRGDAKASAPPEKGSAAEHVAALDLSILIVTWNSERFIDRCLRSIAAACQGLSYEVVVYDNASGDDTLAHLARGAGGSLPIEANVIRSSSNRGFAAGINHAFAASRGRYVFLLNPDCELAPGALTMVFRFIEEHPHVAAAAPLLIDEGGDSQHEFQLRRLPTLGTFMAEVLLIDKLFPKNPATARYRYHDLDLTAPRRVEQPAAAALLLRRETVDEIGPLDEAFAPAWFEDVDYCRRLAEKQKEVWVVPAAQARHFGGASLEHIPFGMFVDVWYRNMVRYARKWMRPWHAETLRWGIIAGMLLRCVACIVGFHPRGVARWEAFRGYRNVLRKAFERWSPSSSPSSS